MANSPPSPCLYHLAIQLGTGDLVIRIVGDASGENVDGNVGGTTFRASVVEFEFEGLEFSTGGFPGIPGVEPGPEGATGENGTPFVGAMTVEDGAGMGVGFTVASFQGERGPFVVIAEVSDTFGKGHRSHSKKGKFQHWLRYREV